MKPIVVLKTNPREYAKVANLAGRVIASLTGNASFTTPLPALATLATAQSDVLTAIDKWGPKGNRGSHADLVDLRDKTLTLYNMLKAEADYVQNTALIVAGNDYSAMAAMIATSGFEIADAKSPVGLLQAPRDLHNPVSPSLPVYKQKVKWARPLGCRPGDVGTYSILRSETSNMNDAATIAIVTDTEFTDTNASGIPATRYYWVVAYNSAGAGAPSDVLMIKYAA